MSRAGISYAGMVAFAWSRYGQVRRRAGTLDKFFPQCDVAERHEIRVNAPADIAFVAANCYDHLNRFDLAESLYLRAIELSGTDFDPAFNLGLLYFKQSVSKKEGSDIQDLGRAIQWLEKANEISPNSIKSLQALQLAYQKSENQDMLERVNNKLKQLTNQ